LTVGGGALFGTGAFSSVEANRTVDVETAGDASALVGLNITSDDLDGQGEDDIITFDTENDLNVNATTEFTDAFEITNNRASGNGSINVDITDGNGNSLVTTDASGEDVGMYFEVDSETQLGDISDDSGTEIVDIVFNLKGETTTSAANGAIPDTITVVANDASGS